MRPGVEKRGSHGLFNDKDEPIILNQAADKIANHPEMYGLMSCLSGERMQFVWVMIIQMGGVT